jgi:energy-coupling factor transporter ATP-binding protein EcfA2
VKSYDFGILSPFEFECFVRDILCERDSIDYSSFAEGRDGGIDLRASYGEGKKIIVQAKRYKTWKELKQELKKEIDKVKKLNPDRYIVATSVDLTVGNVDEIRNMFSSYIKDDTDVLGKQSLNSLLGRPAFKHIELQYYKLWLSSSDLMQAFINKHIINQSSIEMKEIKETVRTFVMNPCFDKAMKILLENHYVILSGVPGVGKTTLARMMSYLLLSKKEPEYHYDQFYFIADDIDNAYKVLQDGEKQLFLFDDFLGSTRFQQDGKNFDSKLLKFIHEVRRQKDKLFILTTREYILNDAKNYYEKLKDFDIDLVKCVIDVGEYSTFVKGEILYNHLFNSGMSHEYIASIKANRNYMKLIKHPNFNPRIVESFIKQASKETISPNIYFQKVLGYFNNPGSVWEGAYDQLEQTAKEMVLVLATMGSTVMYDDWKRACRWFHEQCHNGESIDKTTWNHCARSLSDCFITIESGFKGEYVKFYNPSIEGFAVKVISEDIDIQRKLIENSVFAEQIFTIFQDAEQHFKDIEIKQDLYVDIINAFEELWKNFASCKAFLVNDKLKGTYCSPYPISRVEFINDFYHSFRKICRLHPEILTSKVDNDLLHSHYSTAGEVLALLENVELSLLSKTVIDDYFHVLKDKLFTTEECLKFAKSLRNVFADYSEYADSEEFHETLDTVINQDIDNNDNISDIKDDVEEIETTIPSWDSSWIDEALANHRSPEDVMYDDDYDYGEGRYGGYEKDDDLKIDDLFSTLE